MALKFRNIEATPNDPVEEWGVEGVLAAIERGSLPHWSAISRAVRTDPHGVVAEDLAAALAVAEPGPIAGLLTEVLADARRGPAAEVQRRLRRAVRRARVSQRRFGQEIGTSPSRLSTYLSGQVMPSAAFLIEAERIADRLARDAPLGPPPGPDRG